MKNKSIGPYDALPLSSLSGAQALRVLPFLLLACRGEVEKQVHYVYTRDTAVPPAFSPDEEDDYTIVDPSNDSGSGSEDMPYGDWPSLEGEGPSHYPMVTREDFCDRFFDTVPRDTVEFSFLSGTDFFIPVTPGGSSAETHEALTDAFLRNDYVMFMCAKYYDALSDYTSVADYASTLTYIRAETAAESSRILWETQNFPLGYEDVLYLYWGIYLINEDVFIARDSDRGYEASFWTCVRGPSEGVGGLRFDCRDGD